MRFLQSNTADKHLTPPSSPFGLLEEAAAVAKTNINVKTEFIYTSVVL